MRPVETRLSSSGACTAMEMVSSRGLREWWSASLLWTSRGPSASTFFRTKITGVLSKASPRDPSFRSAGPFARRDRYIRGRLILPHASSGWYRSPLASVGWDNGRDAGSARCGPKDRRISRPPSTLFAGGSADNSKTRRNLRTTQSSRLPSRLSWRAGCPRQPSPDAMFPPSAIIRMPRSLDPRRTDLRAAEALKPSAA